MQEIAKTNTNVDLGNLEIELHVAVLHHDANVVHVDDSRPIVHANRYRTFSALPDENTFSITPEARSVFATAM